MPTVDVYADILFLINAAMDGLCLIAAARLCHRPHRGWRIILAMILGGVYATLALLLPGGRWLSLGVDLAVCLVMCLVAFGRRRLPAVTAVYVALSMALGGVMTALYNRLNQSGFWAYLPAGEDGAGAWVFLILALAGTLVTLRGGRFCRRAHGAGYATVTVTVGTATVSLRALVDTGHHLEDPLDGRAVICVDSAATTSLLSPALTKVVATMQEGHIPDTDILSTLPEAHRIRLIPTNTATGRGLLLALRPDCVTITPVSGPRRHTGAPREVDALIALIPSPDGDFQALLPAELGRS